MRALSARCLALSWSSGRFVMGLVEKTNLCLAFRSDLIDRARGRCDGRRFWRGPRFRHETVLTPE